ncbi:MAG: AAA family ATPase [Patescibacteria group bacterium]
MLKIAFCGAHGTGKTTLVNRLASELNIHAMQRVTREAWENFGVEDFEKIPLDARSVFQNYLLLNQIKKEDLYKDQGFVTDRSVLDILCYTELSSDMKGSSFDIFKHLVVERLKNYNHLIYIPIEFEAQKERLRANLDTRSDYDNILKKNLQELVGQSNFLVINGSVDERLVQIKEYLNQRSLIVYD